MPSGLVSVWEGKQRGWEKLGGSGKSSFSPLGAVKLVIIFLHWPVTGFMLPREWDLALGDAALFRCEGRVDS